MITVRNAKSGDEAVLADILVRSFAAAFSSIISEEMIKRCTDRENCTRMFEHILASGDGQFYLASLDGMASGALYWREGEELEDTAEFIALHSLPKTWGSGIGKALVEEAFAEIKVTGKKAVYLWVFKENARAKRFYEKHGFLADGAERISEFDDAVELRYVRTL